MVIGQQMPTILRAGPFRFFFYSGDGNEPPHVHVERDESTAKIWLQPVRLCSSDGFRRSEISVILRTTRHNRDAMLEAWNDYFGG
ncbi:MAG: DUF4160 domain-containing protein [Halioglobus sp.]